MNRFRWLPERPIEQAWDLRACGWALVEPGDGEPASCPVLSDAATALGEVHGALSRSATMVLGLDDSLARARALAQGFGDVMASSVRIEEIEQRALRLASALEALPRRRRHGALELDLVLRDGLVGGRRLGLHPREFALLWRLARQPGRPVSAAELIAEVWQLNFRPETNSLAVHVCRLRAKLASAGLPGLVSTAIDGGYALSQPDDPRPALAPRRALTESQPSRAASGANGKRVSHDT